MEHDTVCPSPMKPMGRSKITNGVKMLSEIDGRSAVARRMRDILRGLEIEFEITSDSDLVLVKQAAILAVMSERLQAEIVTGSLSSIVTADSITRMAGQLRRILGELRRRTGQHGPPPPSLHQHLSLYGQTLDVEQDDDEDGD